VPELRLTGCASRPLLGYLKGLGVLRVVARQGDDDAKGRWQDGEFELASWLDRDALSRLFLDTYAPAPVVSPWNGGSGFYPQDRQEPILAIEASAEKRLAPYRSAIAAARKAIADQGLADKPSKDGKAVLVRSLRRIAPDESLDWIDAALVIRGEGLAYPPLLGSGGNDGRFDFSNNYARCVVECILDSTNGPAQKTLSASLWNEAAELQRELSLAHLSRDGSPNNAPYGEADNLGNPWDLLLAVEGSLVLTASAARRHDTSRQGSLTAPFTVSRTAAGYGSAVNGESGRAELWLPLWEGWTTLSELSTLAREARAQVGGVRRRQAATGLDFARAAGELGVARGIAAFERYAILERAGQSNLAVPVGRIAVEERPAAQALRGIDAWLTSAQRLGARDECPQGPREEIRHLEQAAFEFASKGTKSAGCATLEAIGAVEAALSRSSSAAESMWPLFGAAARAWVDAADDGSPDFAVAVGVASLRDRRRRKDGRGDGRAALPTMRDYIHGTVTDSAGNVEFDPERSRAVAGERLVPLLAALHTRRHLDAARATGATAGSGRLSFQEGVWISLEAARLLAADQLDNRRVLALLRGLVALDFDRDAREGREPVKAQSPKQSRGGAVPVPIFELLALAWQPPLSGKGGDPRVKRALGRIPKQSDVLDIGARPRWASQLAAGAIGPVIEDALLRLRMAGLPPLPRAGDLNPGRSIDPDLGRRLSAALLLHLGPRDLRSLTKTYISPKEKE
jgi:CRISPR-associated protein Csx17